MMRLPTFRYEAPRTARAVVAVLAGEGPSAQVVAGGTDLYPNMKRRHQMPRTLVSNRHVEEMRGIAWSKGGALRMGSAERLRTLERDERLRRDLPALWSAIHSISTPLLRNMGTIGGNVLLDTRCNYYDQNYEWRRAIGFCMKCDGDICWVAPSSPRCWAVNSSDGVPALMALGARARLLGPAGEREVAVADLFRDDGIDYLTKRPDEVLLDLEIPPQEGARSVYRKVRRRGAFDFPVLGVAARIRLEGDRVASADVVLGGVGSAPVVCREAAEGLVGQPLDEAAVARAAERAWKPAKPLDNTDHHHAWRKKMVKVEVRRALSSLGAPRPAFPGGASCEGSDS